MRARARRRLRALMLALVAVLFAASIPWYRSGDSDPGVLWGLPAWVAVALACYAGVAVANAVAWWLTEIPERPGDDGDGR